MTALLRPPPDPFWAAVHTIDPSRADGMRDRSWRADPRCPSVDDLRLIELLHVGFDGRAVRGQLVMGAPFVAPALALFARLYAIGFPIRTLLPIDHFDGDDDASMAADNSSGFNFRVVVGTRVLSQHAVGRAIDLNPVENPWVRERELVPAAGSAFADRRNVRPGMIVRPGPVTAVLDELGWEWGGDWKHTRDYHHIVAPR